MILDSPIISGSASIAGDLTVGGIVYANVNGTASYASNSDLLDGLDSSVFTISSSFNAYTSSVSSSFSALEVGIATASAAFNVRISTIESKYATTGSNQFNGNQVVTGSLTVTGQVIAQTLNVQQVTSSVVYSSGSNVFGNNISNTHQFTGSVLVTGSVVASSIARTGGTSNQFLKADGTVDSSVYATTSSLTNYVNLTADQNINGRKSFIQGQVWFATDNTGPSVGANTGGIFFGSSVSSNGTTNITFGNEASSGGTEGIVIGFDASSGTAGAVRNISIGSKAGDSLTTGSGNIMIGTDAGRFYNAIFGLQTPNDSIFIGGGTKGATNTDTNAVVIGTNAVSNGSNTVTIGNSSVTDNYFTGNIRGGAFIKSGGTSSQFLKADGSVDGTSYATAASISGTTNYIPKFTSASAIGNSALYEESNKIGYNTTTPVGGGGAGDRTFAINSNSGSASFLTGMVAGTRYSTLFTSSSAVILETNAAIPLSFNTNNVERGKFTTSAFELTVPINGTSLSMSGGINKLGTTDEPSSIDNITAQNFISAPNSNFGNALLIRTDGSGRGFKLISANFNNSTNTGTALSFGTDNIQAFSNGNSSTSSLKLQASGSDVLIGGATTDGANKLIVNGGVKASSLDITGTVARFNSTGNWMEFNTNVLTSNDNSGAHIRSVITDATVPTYSWKGDQNTGMWNPSADEIGFATGGVNRMTIGSTGAATFSSLGTGTVYSNGGTLTNTNPSDRNLKTDIAQITYGLEDILKLNPITFNWKDDKINQGKQYGFIAQEVQEIMPDLVKDGDYLGLDKEAIFTILVKAVQELKAELDELKANK